VKNGKSPKWWIERHLKLGTQDLLDFEAGKESYFWILEIPFSYRSVPNKKTGTNRFYQSLFWKSYSSKLPFGFDEFNDPKYRDWFRDCSNICRNSASVGGIVFSWISLKYAEGNELETDEFFFNFRLRFTNFRSFYLCPELQVRPSDSYLLVIVLGRPEDHLSRNIII